MNHLVSPVDLSEIEYGAVVESNDGGRLLVIRTPLQVITHPAHTGEEGNTKMKRCRQYKNEVKGHRKNKLSC